MSLLGTPLLVVLGLIALAMPAATVAVWSRTRGPRWARAAQRSGLVLVAQATALCFGLAALNDYGQFFTSWSDLVGTGAAPHVVAARHFGGSSGLPQHHRVMSAALSRRPINLSPSPLTANGVMPTSWSTRQTWRTNGAVMTLQVGGATTGLSEPALVYLPPSYFTGQRAMPVTEVFTGYPGSTAALVDRLDYPSHLLASLRQGAASPMVLVMLRPSVTYPRDTECTNVPGGPQAFSYFSTDVPAVIDRVFGLQPTGYAAIGDSTGGMCATKLAVMDPQRFTVAASLSGYYRAITDWTTGDLYGGSTAVQNANDIMWRLGHLPAPHISLLVATALTEGGADGYRSAQRLLALVRSPMSADEIVLNQGGHNFRTWNLEIPHALDWISQHLRA